MSDNNLLIDAGETAAGRIHADGGGHGSDFESHSDVGDSLVKRAKAIIAGRILPAPMVIPPGVMESLHEQFGACEPPPTLEALRDITDRICLDSHYRGEPVACFTTTSGTLTVLAAGERDIMTLLRSMSHEERSVVLVTDTQPC